MKNSRRIQPDPAPKRSAVRKRGIPAIEWLDAAVGRRTRATVLGSRCVLVENHRGILAYSPGRVRLSAGTGCLCVFGESLTLCDVREGSLVIRGEIHRVELPCEGGDAP